MTKRKNKNIILNQEASDYLRRRLNRRIIPYNPTIIEDKIFITTVEEVKKDGRQDAE